jgi:hypothetical protein
MGEFFKGWKRKIGLLTLLMAVTMLGIPIVYTDDGFAFLCRLVPFWQIVGGFLALSAYLFLSKP